jgi:hypothetical protein
VVVVPGLGVRKRGLETGYLKVLIRLPSAANQVVADGRPPTWGGLIAAATFPCTLAVSFAPGMTCAGKTGPWGTFMRGTATRGYVHTTRATPSGTTLK